jgi:hypothetical protein
MKLEWVIDEERQPICGAPMAKGLRVKCELPWDHIVGGAFEPVKLDYHTGRNRSGAWLTWT